MERLLIFSILIFNVLLLEAQPRYPAAADSSGIDLCTASPWVMILNEEFDQPVLDPMWITHNSWCGMNGGDNDNWQMGRWGNNRKGSPDFLMLDKNVELRPEEGVVALKNYKEPAQWKCPDCPESDLRRVAFTSGTLNLRYSTGGAGGCGNGYILNNGKIEIRARLSDHRYAYGSLWLWYGSGGVNELDIVEAKGERRPNTFYPKKSNASWNVHEWNAEQHWLDYLKDSFHNADMINYVRLFKDDGTPLHVDGSLTIRRAEKSDISPRRTYMVSRYGRNDWFRSPGENDFDNWHTYTVEWDEHTVKFLLDEQLIAYIPQYYKKERRKTFGGLSERSYNVAPSCINKETLYFNNGFPWHTLSQAQLRINNGYHNELFEANNANEFGDSLLGEMLVDYVRIYVREQHLPALKATSAWGALPRKPLTGQAAPASVTVPSKTKAALKTLPVLVTVDSREGQRFLLLYDDYIYPVLATTMTERPDYEWTVRYKNRSGDTSGVRRVRGQYVSIPWPEDSSVVLDISLSASFPLEDTILHSHMEINYLYGIAESKGAQVIVRNAYIDDCPLFDSLVEAAMDEHLFYEYELLSDTCFNEIGYRYIADILQRFYLAAPLENISHQESEKDLLQ